VNLYIIKGENVMLFLIFILFLALGIFFTVGYNKSQKKNERWSYNNDKWLMPAIIAFVLAGFIMVTTIVVGLDYSSSMIIDEKIAYLTEENLIIEKQIETVVSNYQNYEQSTFEKFKVEPNVLMATFIFPELKSDKLVQQQIELYRANHSLIKELELNKISYKVHGWWLFFKRGE